MKDILSYKNQNTNSINNELVKIDEIRIHSLDHLRTLDSRWHEKQTWLHLNKFSLRKNKNPNNRSARKKRLKNFIIKIVKFNMPW